MKLWKMKSLINNSAMSHDDAPSAIALIKDDEKYRLLLQSIRTAVVVHRADSRIIMSNPMAQELLGLSEGQMQGKTSIDPAWNFVREDGSTMPIDEYPVNRTIAIRNSCKDLIIGVRHPDQSEIRWCLANTEPMWNREGEINEVVVTFVDITKYKQTEQNLALMNFALNNVHESAYLIDEQSRFHFVNTESCRILGYTRAELLNMGVPDVDPDFPLERWVSHWSELKEQRSLAFQSRHQTKEGHIFPVEVNANYFEFNGQGYNLALVRDITERKHTEDEIKRLNEELENRVAERTEDLQKKSGELKENQMALMNIVEDLNDKTLELEQANDKLKELDQLKSMFIASMSHELRTPLNSIIGYSSILLNEWVGPMTEEQKENTAAVLRSGRHLLSLINDVIDVSRIEAGKIESVFEDIDIRSLLSEALEPFRSEIQKKGLEVIVQAPDSMILHTDRRRLLQCLLNLVSNAVKYTRQGSIRINVERVAEESMVTITIEDTGVGILKEDQQKLFLPFVRLKTPLERLVPGTGLGLYLTKKLVKEILKGELSVTSTYGTGSRFSIRVPVATAD